MGYPSDEQFEEARRHRMPPASRLRRPCIVTLCGSTRFMDAFFDAGWRETLAGKIVLSVGVWREGPADHAGEWLGEDVKARLDELHLRKIDISDEVLILNVGGYIGKSTQRELDYARAHGKIIRFLESDCAADEKGEK